MDAFILSYDLGAEMLNFGALIAFMGVNLAAFMRYYVRDRQRKISNLAPPWLGLLICLLLWLNLSRPAQIAGGIWMLAGIALGAWRTRGFQSAFVDFAIQPKISNLQNLAGTAHQFCKDIGIPLNRFLTNRRTYSPGLGVWAGSANGN